MQVLDVVSRADCLMAPILFGVSHPAGHGQRLATAARMARLGLLGEQIGTAPNPDASSIVVVSVSSKGEISLAVPIEVASR